MRATFCSHGNCSSTAGLTSFCMRSAFLLRMLNVFFEIVEDEFWSPHWSRVAEAIDLDSNQKYFVSK